MTQLATLVLKDYADSDVSFVPRDIAGGVATTVNTTGVPIGDKTVSYSVTRTSTGKRKVTVKLVIPVVQDGDVGGITRPVVVRTAYVDCVLSFDGASSTAERRDVLAYLVSALKNTGNIKPAIEDLSAPY